jgi:surface polysaccharide O-acyltransferase-like enzyme
MRFFAILSVIFAHCATILDESIVWDYSYFQIATAFGIVGVPVFFFSSGYFFYNNQRKNYGAFLYHKIKTYFIPWIFLTSIVYLYVALRKDGLDFKDYMFFLVGIQNYTYFLSILLIFFLVFLKSKFSMSLIIFSVLLSILSLFLTTGLIMDVNPYMNPFNWLVYFIIGVLFKKKEFLMDFAMFSKKWLLLFMSVFVCINIIFILYRLKINYWQVGGYLYILIGFLLFLGISTKYCYSLNKFIIVGQESMSIYLIHSLFVGGIVYITNQFELWYLFPLRPFIVLALVMLVIFVYKKASRYFNIEKYSLPLLGLSKKK